MTKCRGCGMELGDTEIDICKTCCRGGARDFIRQSERRQLKAMIEDSDDAEP